MSNPLANPLDPLNSVSEQERKLFIAMDAQAKDVPLNIVIGAALNIIVNAVRISQQNRANAESLWDNSCGVGKELLLKNYDSVTGQRRNVFAFTQIVEMPLHIEPDNFYGIGGNK